MEDDTKKKMPAKTYPDSVEVGEEFKEGEYMKRCMTGMEAYRVLWHCLDIWRKQLGKNESDFIVWLWECMERNDLVQEEWERSIREMIKERDENYGDDLHAYRLPNQEGVLKPCDCCDKCRFRKI